jgi:YHS domain-containing protein
VFFFLMRMGCGGHVGHGGHGGHDDSAGEGGPAGHGTQSDRDTQPSASYRDPVCGMQVGRDTGYMKMYRGVEYRFCSRDCLDKFDASPEQYAGREPPATAHGGHSS